MNNVYDSKPFYRARDGILWGIITGLAHYLRVPVLLVRGVVVFFLFITFPVVFMLFPSLYVILFLAYCIAGFFIPEEPVEEIESGDWQCSGSGDKSEWFELSEELAKIKRESEDLAGKIVK